MVAERQPRSYHPPRAGHSDHEVARIVQSVGLSAE